MPVYNKKDFIQEITSEMRGYGRYKYRVLGRDGFPSHHTNSLSDAEKWFDKCVDYWNSQESV